MALPLGPILAFIVKKGVNAAIKKFGKKAVAQAQKNVSKTKPKSKPKSKKKETAEEKRKRLEKEDQKRMYEEYMEEEISIRDEIEREGLRMRSGGLTTKKYVNPVTIVDNLKKKK